MTPELLALPFPSIPLRIERNALELGCEQICVFLLRKAEDDEVAASRPGPSGEYGLRPEMQRQAFAKAMHDFVICTHHLVILQGNLMRM